MAKIQKAVDVEAPVHRVFRLWSDVENFPGFMEHVQAVQRTGDRTTHWVVEAPLGRTVEWDARTTVLDENRRIAWQATGSVGTSGEVRFTADGSGRTHVEVDMEYHTPGGPVGELLAKVFENPSKGVEEDLRRFKELAEGTTLRS
ncbi:MAG TPA: SRPBCC family protein [Longimicrobiales bacterium]|nr:SRPBCC family protein [Longimicrobiales bacterium]